MSEKLDRLIPQYAANKSELDSYKKICDRENIQIKRLMQEEGVTERTAGGFVAKCTVSQRETMNESMLLDILHQFGIEVVIKKKEYVDFDMLEKLIYEGSISPEILEQFNKARETKQVVTLRVTKESESTKDDN